MNDIIVKPLETYEPPNVPTLAESRKNPDFLKKLPLRWRKHAALLAAAGLMGAWALAGCAEPNPYIKGAADDDFTYTAYIERDLELRMHVGGSGGAWYVVYLTEQEMLGIIRAQLEMAGLRFGAQLPKYSVEIEVNDFDRSYTFKGTLKLYDDVRGVAVAFTNARSISEILSGFKKQNKNITFGVFSVPGTNSDLYAIMGEAPSDEEIETEKARARPILEEELNNQIQKFIELLRKEGII
jgi:hypothetical protein